MPSLPKLSTAGMAFLLSFLPHLFLLILGSTDVLGGSLREHRLRGSEPDPQRGTPYLPNADMLKALEYIESLRQRTGDVPEEQPPLTPDYDSTGMDDTEKLRSVLRLASPAQSQSQAGRDQDAEEEEEEEEGEGNEEDKTQEWLQAVLSTLEQSEKPPKPAPVQPSAAHHPLMGKGQRLVKEGGEESQVGGGAYPWARQQRGSRPRRKYPLMFEDAEVDERGSEEEQRGSDLESTFKRTSENVEEKYMPQNLATLQSVFEELGRLANGKAGHKRQATAEEDAEDNDDDMFRVRNPDYDDVTGGEDWTPIEQIHTEEEERDNRDVFDQGLEDNDDEYDDEGEGDEENYHVKRSTQPGPGEDSDDITKLVDYYLLKLLEKTEEQEHKREVEEEEQRAERRVAQSQSSDIDPQAITHLIRISQKLQIPPEDLLDMLKIGETTKQNITPQRNRAQTRMPNNLPGVENKQTQMFSHKNPTPVKFYNRRLPETQTSDISEDTNTEDILNILGLGIMGNQKAVPLKQKQHKSSQSQFYAPAGRQGGYTLSQARIPDAFTDDYDDTIDEDELATYLVAQMLTQYPVAANNKADQKRTSEPPSRNEQLALGTFEQAIQDNFDQIDSDKSQLQKRQSETEDMDGGAQTQPLDAEALHVYSILF